MKLNKLLRFISVIMAAAILAGTLSVGAGGSAPSVSPL